MFSSFKLPSQTRWKWHHFLVFVAADELFRWDAWEELVCTLRILPTFPCDGIFLWGLEDVTWVEWASSGSVVGVGLSALWVEAILLPPEGKLKAKYLSMELKWGQCWSAVFTDYVPQVFVKLQMMRTCSERSCNSELQIVHLWQFAPPLPSLLAGHGKDRGW